jgi:hypothetical protein
MICGWQHVGGIASIVLDDLPGPYGEMIEPLLICLANSLLFQPFISFNVNILRSHNPMNP